MSIRPFAIAFVALAFSQAAHAVEFENWALDACVCGKQIGEVIYQKPDASTERFAKFDWQQLSCTWKVDRSGRAPTGVLVYAFALRRSDFASSPESARRQHAFR